uniref:Fibronectin type-III domain-containing protein n=1 Tax=Steinernema glaseri TaxID=37863 RepID=A0A1I7YB97_9BILA
MSSNLPLFAENIGNDKSLYGYAPLVDCPQSSAEENQYMVRYETNDETNVTQTTDQQPVNHNHNVTQQFGETVAMQREEVLNQPGPPNAYPNSISQWQLIRPAPTLSVPTARPVLKVTRVIPVYPKWQSWASQPRVLSPGNAPASAQVGTPVIKTELHPRPRPVPPRQTVDKNAINQLHRLLPQLVPSETEPLFYEPIDPEPITPIQDDDGYAQLSWKKIEKCNGQIPFYLEGHQAIALKGYMVVFGATRDGLNNMVHVYNPDRNMWVGIEVAGECPRGTSGFAMSGYKSSVFIYGGVLNHRFQGDFYELNTSTFEWSRLMVQPNARNEYPRPRTGHTLTVSSDGYCYIFGGVYEQDHGTESVIHHHMNDIFMVNLHLPELHYEFPQTYGPRPPARESHAAALFERGNDKKLIVFGGLGHCRFNDLWILDLNSMTWTNPAVSGIPISPRSHHSINIVGDSLYVFGGLTSTSSGEQDIEKATNTLEMFNLAEGRWEMQNPQISDETKNKVPSPRTMHSMVSIRNRLYLFSGRDGGKKVTTDLWYIDVSRPPPPPRVELLRAGTTALSVHWERILTATSYVLQIQNVGPVPQETNSHGNGFDPHYHEDTLSLLDKKSDVQEEASYSNPESLKTDTTLPHDILADCSWEPSTSGTNTKQEAHYASNSEYEKPQNLWHDVGIIDKNSIRVTHHFLSTRFTEDGRQFPITPGRVDLSLIRKAEIVPGTAYRFRVASLNTCGRGLWSEMSAFKTCYPGLPGSPTDVRITKVIGGAHLAWEPPQHCPGEIIEYTVHLAVKSNSSVVKDGVVFFRFYVGPSARCTVTTHNLNMAHIDNEHGPKPAILFRIAARNDRGYGPATQIRWVQTSHARARAHETYNDTPFPKPYYASSKRIRLE